MSPRAVICASLSQPDEITAVAARLTDAGYKVIAPVIDQSVPPEEHDQRWLNHITTADLVVIIPKPDGTLGAAVARELAWARTNRVPVRRAPTAEITLLAHDVADLLDLEHGLQAAQGGAASC